MSLLTSRVHEIVGVVSVDFCVADQLLIMLHTSSTGNRAVRRLFETSGKPGIRIRGML